MTFGDILDGAQNFIENTLLESHYHPIPDFSKPDPFWDAVRNTNTGRAISGAINSGFNALDKRFPNVMTTARRIEDDLRNNPIESKKLSSVVSDLVSPDVVNSEIPLTGASSGNTSGHTVRSGTTAKPITYSEWTPAAQHFGMDQATAYSEHMANTAHQREVADLRAAGLNPVLGLGSGASGVSGSVASSIGSGYSGSSSAKKDNGKFIDALGATTAVIATLVTKNPTTGGMIGTAVKALGKAFDD